VKSNGFLKFIIVLLIIFFSFKTLSEIAFVKGAKDDEVNPGMIKLSTQIFPVASCNYYKYGSFLLNRYAENNNIKVLEESREMFERSLELNNLNFSSHFLLGRSYLASESSNPLDFEKGLRLIKNASSIRKTNLGINVDTIKIYLSLWPFIDKEDKETAVSLMKISMQKIDKSKFEKIMETWGFYSKDPTFLSSILNSTGRHYLVVHKELIKHELDLKFRHKLLAQSEFVFFKRIEKDRSKYDDNMKKIKSLLKRLAIGIKGYYKFIPDAKFRETALINLKKELLMKSIKALLDDLDQDNISKVLSLSHSYLDSFDLTRDIELLDDLLIKKKFYNSNDLKVFYLKQLMNFKTGQVSKMIMETEGFRRSVTFVKDGQEKELAKLLILLVDGYINARLLTKAMDILEEIEKISPGLMSTYWRLMKIESVIGKDEFFADIKGEHFDKIKNSNSILINNNNIKTSVYPYKVDKLIVNLDEGYSEKFREFHLLQVFLNGRIFHESYIEELKLPIELPLERKLKKEKFEVEVNLVK